MDVFIFAILFAGAVRGFMTGLVRQGTQIAGVVIGFLLSARMIEPMRDFLVNHMGVSPWLAKTVGFALIFGLVQLALFFLARMMEGALGALHLSVVNRAAGAGVGALKAALLLSVLFILMGFAGFPREETRERSTLYEPVASVLPTTWKVISGGSELLFPKDPAPQQHSDQ